MLKFMFSKKATIIDEIFAVNLALCSKCQIDGEDFVDFCGLLRKHELYLLQFNFLLKGGSFIKFLLQRQSIKPRACF